MKKKLHFEVALIKHTGSNGKISTSNASLWYKNEYNFQTARITVLKYIKENFFAIKHEPGSFIYRNTTKYGIETLAAEKNDVSNHSESTSKGGALNVIDKNVLFIRTCELQTTGKPTTVDINGSDKKFDNYNDTTSNINSLAPSEDTSNVTKEEGSTIDKQPLDQSKAFPWETPIINLDQVEIVLHFYYFAQKPFGSTSLDENGAKNYNGCGKDTKNGIKNNNDLNFNYDNYEVVGTINEESLVNTLNLSEYTPSYMEQYNNDEYLKSSKRNDAFTE